jgi:hypothetical protein
MQATVAQWQAWRATGNAATCTDCHDSHAIRGSHDPALVASALAIDVCASRSAIVVEIVNHGAGHNVPSGGVHRRIVVRAWRSTAPERFIEHMLGRRFRPLADGGKQTISDTTIAPGGVRSVRFAFDKLGSVRDSAVNVELRYIYALDEHAKLPTDVSHVIWHRRVEPAALARCAQ